MGTSFINNTIRRLLELSKANFILILRATASLLPVLFSYDVDVTAGTEVVEPEKTIRSTSESTIPSQVGGTKLLTMAK